MAMVGSLSFRPHAPQHSESGITQDIFPHYIFICRCVRCYIFSYPFVYIEYIINMMTY